jgi:hypothetical protein
MPVSSLTYSSTPATGEDACLGNCVHDLGCDDYDWWTRGTGYNPGGGDPGDDPFSLLY